MQELIEATFKGWMEADIPLKTIIISLHNVSAHGEHIPEDLSDDELEKLFEGYDICLDSLPD